MAKKKPRRISLDQLFTVDSNALLAAIRNLVVMWEKEHELFNPLMEAMYSVINHKKVLKEVFTSELIERLSQECGFKTEYIVPTKSYTLEHTYFSMLFVIHKHYRGIDGITEFLAEDVKFLRYLKHLNVYDDTTRAKRTLAIVKDIGTPID